MAHYRALSTTRLEHRRSLGGAGIVLSRRLSHGKCAPSCNSAALDFRAVTAIPKTICAARSSALFPAPPPRHLCAPPPLPRREVVPHFEVVMCSLPDALPPTPACPPAAADGNIPSSRQPVAQPTPLLPWCHARTPPACDIPTPSAAVGGCSSFR